MEYLKKVRKAKGFSQVEMAKMLGLGQTSYSYYETGKNQPSLETLTKLSKILEVSIDYLITGQEFSNTQNFTFEQMEIAKLLKLMNQKQLNRVHGYVLGLLEQNADYKAN